MCVLVAWTSWAKKRFEIYATDVAGICEAPGQPEVLGFLRRAPANIQKLAEEKYALLKSDPRHPSLHFKKVGSYWSVRVGIHYRAIAIKEGSEIVWFWIGHHSEYDKLIKGS
jgi:hypothetical protein